MTVFLSLSSRQVAVHFANGSKVKVTLSTTETTSDLLEMSEIKEQLSSSSAYIVRVDEVGKGQHSLVIRRMV